MTTPSTQTETDADQIVLAVVNSMYLPEKRGVSRLRMYTEVAERWVEK